jgi:hypothetical protein
MKGPCGICGTTAQTCKCCSVCVSPEKECRNYGKKTAQCCRGCKDRMTCDCPGCRMCGDTHQGDDLDGGCHFCRMSEEDCYA